MRGRGAGFTLLEVLVAFIIAALAIGALLQGSAGGLQNARVAAHYQEAISRAQSRMDLLQANLRPGEQRGDDGGGFTWRVLVQPGATVPRPRPARAPPPGGQPGAPPGSPAATAQPAEQTVLYAVSVTIAWQLDGGNREVTLSSQRLGVAPMEGP